MDRTINILRLPEEVKLKLYSFGFEYIEDIDKCLKDCGEIPVKLQPLFNEYKIMEKIEAFKSTSSIKSVLNLLENTNPPIYVFHEGLSKLLSGGGLPVGQITELCGPPGSGKTQMCLQFCVDVQVPEELGGSNGEALFISTDFGFQVERLRQICQGTVKHFASVTQLNQESLSLPSLLKGVKIVKIQGLNKLYEILGNLKIFLDKNPKIKLLVVDSFCLPFTLDTEDLPARTKMISFLVDTLLNFAIKYGFALVLTNQLMTVVYEEDDMAVKPALGQAYAHRIHQRLILQDNRVFMAKSVAKPQLFTCFKVTTDGLR